MTQTKKPVITFSKRDGSMDMPHLLDIQTAAFQSLLKDEDSDGNRQDVSLERVFRDLFPISDVNGKYSLDFLRYAIGEPKYTVEECIERDMTYAAPLKATLQLIVFEEVEGEKRPKNIIEKEVYLGELPIMTPLGTFVINGAERVVVSQLHRSPGVVFEEDTHPNGQRLFSARIIPFRGSWVEFTIDIHDVIYVHIDKKKKFPATALLRAFGYGENADILKLFFATKDAVARRQDGDAAGEARAAGRAAGRGRAEPRGAEGRPAGCGGRRAHPRARQRHAARGRQEGAHLRRLHHDRPARRREPDVDPRAGRPGAGVRRGRCRRRGAGRGRRRPDRGAAREDPQGGRAQGGRAARRLARASRR